ncbi:hypothetical protein [Ferrovibrio sp.]|uniref:hypothetical protein n=1 Tax=Ferrovibrio sp. TaxID=1917215 RepID=UPI0035AFD4D5
MKKPMYIDPKALEATLRENFAKVAASASAAASGPEDLKLVELQTKLLQLQVEAHVALVHFRNNEENMRLVAKAFGSTLGQCALALMLNLSTDVSTIMVSSFYSTIKAGLTGIVPEGIEARMATCKGTQGGNA